MGKTEYYQGKKQKAGNFILIINSFLILFLSCCTASSGNAKPSHYGVYIRQDGDLLELSDQKISSIPTMRHMNNLETAKSSKPIIVIWRQNVNLDYLDFFKLGQYINEHERIPYFSTPGSDGIFEITPKTSLENGKYCIVQGDPLSAILPGWCFEVGSESGILSPNQSPTNTNNMTKPEIEINTDEMILIPAGEFPMGCDPSHNGGYPCPQIELPQHTVYLDAYRIDKYEVTNAQYAKCPEINCGKKRTNYSNTRSSYYDDPSFANYPVINVSSEEAVTFCNWAGKRLPTEAEWEKAAHGSKVQAYPWGSKTPSCEFANSFNEVFSGNCLNDTSPVGSYPAGASPYGVMDMSGNVYEWVADWAQADYYTVSPVNNPKGPSEKPNNYGRVLRGGGWSTKWYGLRVTARFIDGNTSEEGVLINDRTGFRCAASP